MPELLEIEMYRRGAETVVGRSIERVDAPDDWYVKRLDPAGLTAALEGAAIESLGRIGKLMLVETTAGSLGLRFGMTGILVVDDVPVLASLEYSSKRRDAAWNRFALHFVGGGSLVMNDPRRLGGVELEPDLGALGPDAWAVTGEQLVALVGRYRVAIKALLLNQRRIAGLGNLLVDELLWRCSVSPMTPANELAAPAAEAMAEELGPMLATLYERGGSNCGDMFAQRKPGGCCPRDGAELTHGTVGGRSTWWCPAHQV